MGSGFGVQGSGFRVQERRIKIRSAAKCKKGDARRCYSSYKSLGTTNP